MEYKLEKLENVSIVKLNVDNLDVKNSIEFKTDIIQLIEEGNTNLIIDLTELEFIDSSGLGAIVSCLKVLGRQGDIVIAKPNNIVLKLFTLTRMDKVFKIFTNTDDAIKNFD